MFFLSLCCQSPFLRCQLQSTYLPRMPPNTVLISGPAVGAAQILIWSTPVCLCPQCPQLSELVRFLLWELSMAFYIFPRQSLLS